MRDSRDHDSRGQCETMYQDLPPTACAASPTPALEPVLAPDAFDELVREIGQDGACEVRAVFWTETSARLKLFDGLAPAQHCARIEREAHSLKSAARTFGYCRLAALALDLESSAAALRDDDYRRLLAAMEAAYVAALSQEPSR